MIAAMPFLIRYCFWYTRFLFARCNVCISHFCALWIKKLSWLRQNTLPAPHDPAINCVPVHRFLSPGCARLLSEWLKWCGGRTVKKWLATLIDDLKFLRAEFKREFSVLGIPPVTTEQHQQRIAEMCRSTVAGKLSRGVLQIRAGC